MIGLALRALARRRLRAARETRGRAVARQHELLLRLVTRAADTRFGKEHDFPGIRGAADWRARVKAQDYESLRPRFERARDGAADELWPGVPRSFVATSGSTGGGKILPHTDESLQAALEGALDAVAAYVVRSRDADLLRAPIALLNGVRTRGRFDSGLAWGDASGLLGGDLPRWLRGRVLPSRATMAIDEWNAKFDATVDELTRRDLRVLVGAPSWCLRLIERVEEKTGLAIRDVWPSWRGLIHGGMAFAPYHGTLRRRVGPGVTFVDCYVAPSGGVLAVQDRDDDPSMLLLAGRNVYFEFTRASDPDGARFDLEEVEPGVAYLVHVTSDAGLWAYRLGDVVRFTGTDPPRLRVVGRADLRLNAFGESVLPTELEAAIAVAARECRCEVLEFTVLPEYPRPDRSRGRHAWIVEFTVLPPDLERFAGALDRALQRANDEYRTHRAGDAQLLPPRVRLAARDSFRTWLERHDRLRGYSKVPRVVEPDLVRGLIPGL